MNNLDLILEVLMTTGWWGFGGSPQEKAFEWLDTNLSIEDIKSWLEAGCFRASAASWLNKAGLSPSQCSKRPDSGFTIAFAVARGDLSVAQAQHIINS